jgi:hypothetical protein
MDRIIEIRGFLFMAVSVVSKKINLLKFYFKKLPSPCQAENAGKIN